MNKGPAAHPATQIGRNDQYAVAQVKLVVAELWHLQQRSGTSTRTISVLISVYLGFDFVMNWFVYGSPVRIVARTPRNIGGALSSYVLSHYYLSTKDTLSPPRYVQFPS